MNAFNIFGTLNTLFIFISLFGIYAQLNKVWQRKKQNPQGAAEILSLNQFTVSFFAYISFYIYGYSIEPFNHYIVWPRLIASLLVAAILYEIWQNRKTKQAKVAFIFVCLFLVSSIVLMPFGGQFHDQSKVISSTLIILITLFLAQGYYHQIMLIIRSGKTGAVALKMSQFILLMDISTIAFALTMGWSLGWPLMLLATVSATTKLIIMYLFYWVRVSKKAEQIRTQQLT